MTQVNDMPANNTAYLSLAGEKITGLGRCNGGSASSITIEPLSQRRKLPARQQYCAACLTITGYQ